jgi:hypothetical protein
MFNRNSKFVLFFILVILLNSNVYAQTSSWRVIWKRNPVSEKIVYYVVFRKVNSAPSLIDSVGWKPEPTESTPDNLLYYVDSNISAGQHYYYRTQAVDSLNNRSSLSLALNAAIPRIVLVDSLSFPVDSTFSINLNQSQYVVDPDNSLSDLSWSVTGGNLIHITINSSNSATITTPADSTIKETFTFTVADPDSFIDTKSVVITLRSKPVQLNRPPEILSQPLLNASENTLYQYTVTASDADGDFLTFTLGTAPEFLSLQTINATQARLSGTPSSSDVGDHAVTINVSDGKGGFDSQNFVLSVYSGTPPASMILSVTITSYGTSIVKMNWETRTATKDYVQYGTTENYDQSSKLESDYSTLHEKILRELQANTPYHYQIVSEEENGKKSYSTDSTFSTGKSEEVIVFPIPYIDGESAENNGISFTNIPASSTLVIYNLMGEPVFHVENITGVYTWNILNDAGKKINAGIYMYHIKNKTGKRLESGKLIIIR